MCADYLNFERTRSTGDEAGEGNESDTGSPYIKWQEILTSSCRQKGAIELFQARQRQSDFSFRKVNRLEGNDASLEVKKVWISQRDEGCRKDNVFALNLLHLEYPEKSQVRMSLGSWKYVSDAQKRDLALGALLSKHWLKQWREWHHLGRPSRMRSRGGQR